MAICQDLSVAGTGKFHFGWGVRNNASQLIQAQFPNARKMLLVCGSRTVLKTRAYSELWRVLTKHSDLTLNILHLDSCEPSIKSVDHVVQQARKYSCDLIISVGGGAAMDTAKAVAAMYPAPDSRSVRCFLEGVGDGSTIDWLPIPTVAIPTTAGTGAEVTKNAVLQCSDPKVKKSLRHAALVPSLAIVDPELTVSCPNQVTAHSGMDAVTQCIEAFVSCRSTVQTRQWALTGLPKGLRSLSTAYRHPTDRAARTDLSACASYSGYALAYGGLGMAHGVAAALGAICGVRHGLACAVLLPVSINANIAIDRRPYDDLAHSLNLENAEALLSKVQSLNQEFGIPSRLRDVGVTKPQLSELVAMSFGNSMSGNPVQFEHHELEAILSASL